MKNVESYIDGFKVQYEQFIAGCDSLEELGEWDKENLGEMEAYYYHDMASVIIRLIAVDGRITVKETEYLNDTFGFTYTLAELAEMYETCKDDIVSHAFDESFENGITRMRRINGKLADAYKQLLGLICRIIVESDGMIADSEVAEVKRLMAMCQ
jgi:ribosomal protein S19E (S16A)